MAHNLQLLAISPLSKTSGVEARIGGVATARQSELPTLWRTPRFRGLYFNGLKLGGESGYPQASERDRLSRCKAGVRYDPGTPKLLEKTQAVPGLVSRSHRSGYWLRHELLEQGRKPGANILWAEVTLSALADCGDTQILLATRAVAEASFSLPISPLTTGTGGGSPKERQYG
jgi:hypothetical protein